VYKVKCCSSQCRGAVLNEKDNLASFNFFFKLKKVATTFFKKNFDFSIEQKKIFVDANPAINVQLLLDQNYKTFSNTMYKFCKKLECLLLL